MEIRVCVAAAADDDDDVYRQYLSSVRSRRPTSSEHRGHKHDLILGDGTPLKPRGY